MSAYEGSRQQQDNENYKRQHGDKKPVVNQYPKVHVDQCREVLNAVNNKQMSVSKAAEVFTELANGKMSESQFDELMKNKQPSTSTDAGSEMFTREQIAKDAWEASEAFWEEQEKYPYGRIGGYKTQGKEQYLQSLSSPPGSEGKEEKPITHETFVVGFDEPGNVIFFKSYQYKKDKERAQYDLKWVQDNCHHWEIGAATEWKLTHEDICHDIIIPHP